MFWTLTSLLVMELSLLLCPSPPTQTHTQTHTGVIVNSLHLLGKNANFNIIGGHIKYERGFFSKSKSHTHTVQNTHTPRVRASAHEDGDWFIVKCQWG